MAGYFFEDFEEGQIFDHEVRRTVTEYDNMMFSCMTMNTQPLHIDAEFASKSLYGERIVNSMFTLALVVGLQVTDLTLGTTLGNLAMTDISFPRPTFHGDTIHVRTTVLDKRISKSRNDSGIVNLRHEGFNQNDELVATVTRTALIAVRPSDSETRVSE
ncbi:MAG: MaoC family dehydratase [bacterium]|jgi:acyl dehydratase|nr:MaoC family dehydratase [Gammaproteobacteria bacterium]HIL84360.1 MaoC family dehydratase [Pseudomonadales bacterium]